MFGVLQEIFDSQLGTSEQQLLRDSSRSFFHALGYFLLFVRGVFFHPTCFPATLLCCFAFMLTSQV